MSFISKICVIFPLTLVDSVLGYYKQTPIARESTGVFARQEEVSLAIVNITIYDCIT